MYKRILVAIENSAADRTILAHVAALARMTGAELLLVHVADGFAARHFDDLKLRESEEMKADRQYLEKVCDDLERDGIETDCVLAGGDPGKEIALAAEREKCDLIAMSTHGHRFIKDVIYGSVANEVRHLSRIPVLLVRGDKEPQPVKGERA